MGFTPEQQREYRRRLRVKGICTRCHAVDALPGRVLCASCRDYARNENRRRREDPSKCWLCKGPKDANGKNVCSACIERRRGIYWERKGKGLCVDCERPLPDTGEVRQTGMGGPWARCPKCSTRKRNSKGGK